MEKITVKVLMYLSVICVVAGIIAGFVMFDKDIAADAKTSKQVSEELYDNSIAQAQYKTDKALASSMQSSVFFSVLAGVVSVAILFGLAIIIRILDEANSRAHESASDLRLIKNDIREQTAK
ncbi:hypothetical protein J7E26_11055 [Bacillus sp. ISL-51]|uniref:hypothetical protein n=1 Tax=unclassified Bacillus (in: firmicutes) TaxID=185979 RepID=UPI001BE95712|nr:MULTISPECIES: hypothetical protein [unclassified Bacillus (in: firmicutes)]MBT2574487.1 hypothetical protein [Bacillus sp. ISL-51]MBT2633304.1 hypothetical protein [Bacillus sp. ISL-26]